MLHARIREPAVAGLFYPGNGHELAAEVRRLLAEATPRRLPGRPKALIVPHAGYVYSGAIAATAYAQLFPYAEEIERVVLAGPCHRIAARGIAVPTDEGFATPLGVVPIDRQAIATLRNLPYVVAYDAAHRLEHSLEVQLPFLQSVLSAFSLAPLAVGHATGAEVAEVFERLWGGNETLIVVSSDLSHYHSYEEARRLDAATVADIERLTPLSDHEQACGATPINGLIEMAKRRQLAPYVLDLRNSGDTAGDPYRVVGYASIAFLERSEDGGHA